MTTPTLHRSDPSGTRTNSRVRLGDALALAAIGLRARRVRSALSALGIGIAIAALVAVLGIADSSKARLLALLGAEGNLLTVAAGQTFNGDPTPLPTTAETMIARIPPVRLVTAVGTVPGATVRRSAAIPALNTGGISVVAAQPSLQPTLAATLLRGRFLDALADHYPETVLGYSAAQNLGIDALTPATQVYVNGTYFAVIGILNPTTVAPEIDDAALISFPIANTLLNLGGHPTRIYLRADPDQVPAIAAVLPFTAAPAHPKPSKSADPPTCSSPASPPKPHSSDSSSPSAPSHYSSEESASPTSWSSPYSNDAEKSGSAAPWEHEPATSPPNSSSNPPCSPRSVASSASPSASSPPRPQPTSPTNQPPSPPSSPSPDSPAP